MALHIRGIQPLSWGNVVTTGYLTESINNGAKTGEVLVTDEGGDEAIQITGFGVKNDVTLEVIPKASVTPPVVGDVFQYGGSSGTKIVILAIDKKTAGKEVEKWSIKGNFFPNITLTVGS